MERHLPVALLAHAMIRNFLTSIASLQSQMGEFVTKFHQDFANFVDMERDKCDNYLTSMMHIFDRLDKFIENSLVLGSFPLMQVELEV